MGDTIKAREDGVVRREWSRGYFARNCTSFRHITLKPGIYPLFGDSVPTSQGTRRNAITTISFVMVFRTVKAVYSENIREYINTMGTAVAQSLRCCATNRKVAISIPAGVIGIFR